MRFTTVSLREKDDVKSFLRVSTFENKKEELITIANLIDGNLCEFKNFKGVCFIEKDNGDFEIAGTHKMIDGYYYGARYEINCSLSNYKEVVDQFTSMWKRVDNDVDVKEYLDFIELGKSTNWN